MDKFRGGFWKEVECPGLSKISSTCFNRMFKQRLLIELPGTEDAKCNRDMANLDSAITRKT